MKTTYVGTYLWKWDEWRPVETHASWVAPKLTLKKGKK
jgi:hypothetical protein